MVDHHGCMAMLKALLELGGEASCKKLSTVYGGKPTRYVASAVNIGKRARKYFKLEPLKDGDVERFFVIPFLGRRIAEDGGEFYSYKLRDELKAAMEEIDLSGIDPHVIEEDEVSIEEDKKYSAEDFLSEVYMTKDRYDTLKRLLENKKNLILQGAPGVGKTFAAKRLAYSMMGFKDDSRIEFVQFHQNYSYEDFIMGYKPEGETFELKQGIFYSFCKKAEAQPDKDYFFIIDEINRGNMSKILGELMVLIERDYRGTKATLAYNSESFSVPSNLYIIGMMNTADRSLAMIDYALRRRFSFFEMEPGFSSEGFKKYFDKFNNDRFNRLIGKIIELNKEISNDNALGAGFRIGHSYFCGQEVCTDEWLHEVVEFDILPMLNEYWFDDMSKVQKWGSILRGVFDD